jgi:hypothetical protein
VKICDTCGNEIEDRTWRCPFCEQPTSGPVYRPRKQAVYTVNLKRGLPTVEEARIRLRSGLGEARAVGARVVRVIHGYGSRGVGGRMAPAIRALLRQMVASGQVGGFVEGESFTRTHEAARRLVRERPAAGELDDYGRANPGITVVWW